MPTFSANLGYLWNDVPLADGIRAAKAAGFAAVECHAPYREPIDEVKAALADTGLDMLSINTRTGGDGERGFAAMPGQAIEARLAIDEAVRYASAIGAKAVHVLAGNAPLMPNAFLTYMGNLRYACQQADPHGITILIEPLNLTDNPGYYLHNTTDAAGVIDAVDRPNIKLLFDCYHAHITEGAVPELISGLLPIIGHIQFASVPGRNEPDQGNLDYREIFELLDRVGWDQPLGAEYRPLGNVEDGLGWMTTHST